MLVWGRPSVRQVARQAVLALSLCAVLAATLAGCSDHRNLNPIAPEVLKVIAMPRAHDYGTVLVGAKFSQRFTLTNIGPLDYTGRVAEDGIDFDILDFGDGQFTLAPGESTSFQIAFSPTSASLKSCIVTTGAGGPSIALRGTGVTHHIVVDPSPRDYGVREVCAGADSQLFTLTNSGPKDFNGHVTENNADFNIWLDGASGSGNFILPADSSLRFRIFFKPSSTGSKSCTVLTGAGGPSIFLSGTGAECGTPTDFCDPAYRIPNGLTGPGVNDVAWVNWTVPSPVSPGQIVTSNVQWEFAQTPIGHVYNGDAVVNLNVFGEWAPNQEVVRLIDAQLLGSPRVEDRTFTFTAPTVPGTYHMRWMYITWYYPNTSYYGGRAIPLDNCSPVAWTEITFTVN
jgi:hypothetical protein